MLQILVLERVDHEQNIHRYYVLSIEPTLFGEVGLRREWGRLGRHGGASRLELHEDVEAAKEALTDWLGHTEEGGIWSAVVRAWQARSLSTAKQEFGSASLGREPIKVIPESPHG